MSLFKHDLEDAKNEDLDMLDFAPPSVQMGNNAVMRPHEIYDNTTYIPNN